MAREVALYEIPKTLEVAKVLDDSVLERYNTSVKSAYNSDRARKVLSKFGRENGELTGSNIFMLVHLQNSGLLNERIATRRDLETALRLSPDIFRGNYINFGLALMTEGDSYRCNDLLAKTLAKQLKNRGINLGKLIPISALRNEESPDSAYGLVFKLKDDVTELEDLSDSKWECQREQGIARACLGWVGYWDFKDIDLADSGGYGRVVIVSGEASAENFLDAKLTELQNQRDSEIAAISRRYAQAEKVLLGK